MLDGPRLWASFSYVCGLVWFRVAFLMTAFPIAIVEHELLIASDANVYPAKLIYQPSLIRNTIQATTGFAEKTRARTYSITDSLPAHHPLPRIYWDSPGAKSHIRK